jgi:ABC-type nitrate/sulfonate/bicarbonate transport system substrate-binding protein
MSVVFLVNCQKGKEVEEKTEEITTIRVGYLPSLGASQLYVAIAKGYFKEENLKAEIREIYSGPEIVNTLQAKAVDFALGIVPPIILSRSKGLPIKSVCGATIDSIDIQEHRLILPVNSDIKAGKDLKGKKIAVVAEGTSDYFGLLQYLEKNGLDKSEVEIIKTPHPEMIFAVASKSVDAAASIEPFITIGNLDGKVKIFDFYYPDEPVEIGTYLAHEDFIKNNPEVTKRFINAIHKATDFLKDKKSHRELLPKLENYGIKFKVSKEVADALTIMEFRKSLSEEGIEKVMNQLLNAGFLSKPIDVKSCIYR